MRGAGGPRRWMRAAGSVLGLALFAAAIWIAWNQRTTIVDAVTQAAEARWWLIACVLALPLVSWTLTSGMYWVLMDRPGQWRIGLGEMHCVLALAWLMNFLPARPGMFGRLAYHTVVNKVPLSFAISSSLTAIVCGCVGTLTLLGLAAALSVGQPHWTAALAVLAAPVPAMAGLWLVKPLPEAFRRIGLACGLRYLDVLSWLARYVCIFEILGRPLSLVEAAAFTAVSQAAGMVPFVGNGLGIREWAIGLTGPALHTAAQRGLNLTRGLSITGDLINRAAEITIALPVGLMGGWYVARRMRQRAPEAPGDTRSATLL